MVQLCRVRCWFNCTRLCIGNKIQEKLIKKASQKSNRCGTGTSSGSIATCQMSNDKGLDDDNDIKAVNRLKGVKFEKRSAAVQL